jgi:DNA-binding transcriptional MerR regulator
MLTSFIAKTWTLSELVQAAGELLAHTGVQLGDERIRARPDARTVRYYQSLGVVDRPLRHQGRQAIYGFRHLVQVVCTKLLQAEGHSLAQVQSALAGRTTQQLQAVVDQALQGGLALVVPTSASSAAPRALIAAEIAPGVTLTIDPSVVADPDGVLAALARALNPGGSS